MPKKEKTKKIKFLKAEFSAFWLSIATGIFACAFSFIYFPLIWFIVLCALFAFLTGLSLFMALSAIDCKRENEFEKNRTDKIVSNVSDGIIIYNKSFKVLIWNKEAENIFKIRKEDIIGEVISPEKMSDPSLKAVIQTIFPSLAPAVIKKSLPGEYPQLMDISFLEPNLELSVSTDKIFDKSGELIGFIKIIKNRTREVELLRSKSEFITVAAHQLRTPLTAVHWIFETFNKSDSIKGPDKELVSNGLTASVKLLKIVNDLLDVSKIEAGKFGYNFTQIDMGMFMDDLLENANILAKKFSVMLYFDRPKAPVIIHGDPQKLGIAFSNLIDNAIKYNVENGQVIVKIEPYPNKPYIQISIKDTGIGITKEGLDKLFTKFFRGENVVKEQTEGSGLGLYITKNIILRHGGDISADSALGRGTTFYVVLPTDPALIPPKEISAE
ncbi:MAG: ATP-binding protein [Candidatus Colwellbacteria bacterium]|nr:ATP-binding protein [Candidatus Colwellbacteria bacterium]MDD3752339.1 ATP-binding protein [Candidatus Colwellbacteria bacterium]